MSLVMRVITRPAFSPVKKSMRQPLQVCEDADPEVVEERFAERARPCDPEAARDMLMITLIDVEDRSDDEHLRRPGGMPSSIAALGQQRTGLQRQRLDEHEREGAGHRGLRAARNRRNVNGAVVSSTWVNGTCASGCSGSVSRMASTRSASSGGHSREWQARGRAGLRPRSGRRSRLMRHPRPSVASGRGELSRVVISVSSAPLSCSARASTST